MTETSGHRSFSGAAAILGSRDFACPNRMICRRRRTRIQTTDSCCKLTLDCRRWQKTCRTALAGRLAVLQGAGHIIEDRS